MSQLNIADLNMDETRFGLQNFLPYSNTKCMIALHTKALAKQKGIKAYALCPGMVKTEMIDDSPSILRAVSLLLSYFTTFADEVISFGHSGLYSDANASWLKTAESN